MYPKFIEVHDTADGSEQSVNIACIEGIFCEKLGEDCFCTHIDLVDGNCYQVREDYEEVKQMITDAGCIIAKADPRLDKGELTKEDIKTMDIGEPIWNSNTRKWYLLSGWSDLERGFLVTLNNFNEVNHYDEADLKKYPLYRIKVE